MKLGTEISSRKSSGEAEFRAHDVLIAETVKIIKESFVLAELTSEAIRYSQE